MSSSKHKLDDPSSSTGLDRNKEIDGFITAEAHKESQVEICEDEFSQLIAFFLFFSRTQKNVPHSMPHKLPHRLRPHKQRIWLLQ